ncbi:MAG: tetratricopeptide repeat protein [Vulcanimicrobiaceae bacterium]
MSHFIRLAAMASSLAIAATVAVPASAQYANEYTPPKLVRQGKTSIGIAGSGTVVVQVQVNADGSHKVMRVLHSTNHADDAAAMDIAKNSTYRVGTRGKAPVTAFYDFTLKFTGKSVAASDSGGGASGPTAQIARMIRAGNYQGAKAQATSYLATNPSDPTALQLLGVSNYFLNDYPSAAEAFSKAGTVSPQYKSVAAHAYASAAVALEQSNPTQALAYAKSASQLESSANSYYALGSAELANKDYAAATTDLKKARDLAFADPKTDTKAKVNLDAALMTAYMDNNDQSNAQAMAVEIKRLDPSSTVADRMLGNQQLAAAQAASKAGNHEQAVLLFEQAAQKSSDQQVQVTAYVSAAFEQSQLSKPDYAKMKSDADKALAINANDPQANFAEGVALAGQYITGGSTNAGLKQQATEALNKADSLAKSAGNTALSLQIESFIKNTFK